MKLKIDVPEVKEEAKFCGECPFVSWDRCNLFWENGNGIQLEIKAANNLRHAACRAAEVPAKGDEHANSH